MELQGLASLQAQYSNLIASLVMAGILEVIVDELGYKSFFGKSLMNKKEGGKSL